MKQSPSIMHNTITPELVEKNFPKGMCKERGAAIVLHAEMLIALDKMIKEAYDKGFADGVYWENQKGHT